ncbi:hypothetical protein ASE17_13115 [Phenylobacterium sp. Root77]|nr:hypothetical protein ASC73_14520 [Phenylobacterium sp. Root1277]KQW95477.1 hypothetical protein ASC79_07165 [Phenylobacterium sp. Root1290]KRC41267.1 hypothetical protein ASE17_13115 [Phenylobacterium sp. Root77]
MNWRAATLTVVIMANLCLGGWFAFDRAFLQDLPQVPDKEALWSMGRPPGLTFVGPDGQVIGRRGPRHGPPARLAEMPQHVPLAFLAIEDRRFYQHGAMDLRGVLRALSVNTRAGAVVEGGSTISQQLARNLFLAPEQTVRRKVQEVLLAAQLERMLSKDELLELYLNRIYFGGRAYGLSAAAETYFGKAPRDLTLAEAAVLAALPRAPSRLSPANDPDAAWARGQLVLRRLGDMAWIDPGLAARTAEGPPPPLTLLAADGEGDMAWAFDAAAAEARQRLGGATPDLVIQLTVDPQAQAIAGHIVRRTLAREGARRGARQAALVALAPDGAIRVMIGGADHAASPFNRVTQARRQPGSAFKPIVWAAALDHGVRPMDWRQDAPVRIGGWRPGNYGGGYHGQISVQRALHLSINTVAVRLAREAGLGEVGALARRFGLTGVPENPGGSVALGAYEVTPLELAGAYQVLQTGGGKTSPYLVSKITDARGKLLFIRPPSASVPIYPTYQAAQMVQMMRGVILAGTGREAGFGRLAAGKTGTSQDHRDAWFVGFTPDWLCAVWVGNDDSRPMARVTGGQIPAHIWRDFMLGAHRGLPDLEFSWFPAVPPPLYVEEPPPPAPLQDAFGPVRRNAMARDADLPAAETEATPVDWSEIPY